MAEIGKSFVLDTVCPYCGQENEVATRANEAPDAVDPGPDDGALSVCFTCGKLAVFHFEGEGAQRTLAPRKPTSQEVLDIHDDKDTMEALAVITTYIENRNREADDDA